MKKSKIYATGNEFIKGKFNISYYVLEKDNHFLDWLSNLLVEVFEYEPEEAKKSSKFFSSGKCTKKDYITKIYPKNIKKMIDVREFYCIKKNNKEADLKVFYGQKKVYLILILNLDLKKSREIKEKLAKFIVKTRKSIKFNEKSDLPDYVNKKVFKYD